VKKNAAGHSEVWMLFAGVNSKVSNGISVKVVAFSSCKTVGAKNTDQVCMV
jgi:hypothetical protein